MRCDLHVHTIHSGMCTVPGLRRWVRECYSEPRSLARVLRARGMNLITVTDHDSIDAAEALRGDPGFFLSEEVTCRTAAGAEAHIGVYDITERDHLEIQARRNDLPRLAAYVRERGLFASVNHLVSGITGLRRMSDFGEFQRFEAFETLNGCVGSDNNRCAKMLARAMRKARVAGSDAHTLRGAGRAFTEVPGARNREEFFAGLRAGRGRIRGLAGGWWQLTQEVAAVGVRACREHPALALLAPAMPLIPVLTGLQFLYDGWAAWHWSRRLLGMPSLAPKVAAAGDLFY